MNNNRIYYSEEAEHQMKRKRKVNAFLFTGLGIGVGSAIALLLASKEGDRTREIIARSLEEGFQRGRESVDQALSQLEGDVPNLRERVNELVNKVTP